ncbi:hypothetical protein N7454_009338 [Penicillium verhagenii]|nr:hypothetical protein N7454_009338 [Penicillium verhagenii]
MASHKVEETLSGEARDVEKVSDKFQEDSHLILTEEEAFAKARASPNDAFPILLTYAIDDHDNPRNWPKWRKWYISIFVSMLNVFTYVLLFFFVLLSVPGYPLFQYRADSNKSILYSCWCAGGISSGAPGIQKEFGVSSEITTLALSLYVLGYAIGPVMLAPLSEYFGRQPVYVVSWFFLFLFQLPLALAPNIGTILVFRFIAGCAGGAP